MAAGASVFVTPVGAWARMMRQQLFDPIEMLLMFIIASGYPNTLLSFYSSPPPTR